MILIMDYKIFGNSIQEGDLSERYFALCANKRGYRVTKTTASVDIKSHIDFYLEKNGKVLSFDVKAIKRTQRRGNTHADAVWVEFLNVRGNTGWFFGQQEYLAFDFGDHFIIVRRSELRDYVVSAIQQKHQYVSNAGSAHFRLYQRNGRQDIITRINSQSLLLLSHHRWDKSPDH